jgi:aminomethyltransferase
MKRTPLHEEHVKLGARMVEFAGWEMPIQYKGIIEEHDAVRNKVGIFDVSHMGEIEISGVKAFEFCQTIACNDVSKLKPGKIQYSAILNEQGGVIDDCTLYQMAEAHYLFVVNASRKDQVLEWFMKHKTSGVDITDLSDNYGLLALQGKKSQELLSNVLGRELDSLGYYEFLIAQFSSNVLIVSRTGYSGEDGFELYVPINKTVELWNALMEQGKKFDIQPIGLGARDTLRLEMGYLLYGQDMNENVSALQAGLSWIVKFDKGSFVGKSALVKEKEAGVKKRIRAILMEEKQIPRSHYEVLNQGKIIGEVTSGTFSPTLKKGIALALVDANLKIGDEIQVQVRKNLASAKVVKAPFVSGSVRK